MIEIKGLNFEQNKKYQAAIAAGFFDSYEDDPREWKHSLVGTFIWAYPRRTSTLTRIQNVVGHIPQWDEMTDEVLQDFVDDCVEDGLTSSSVKTVCAELKGVLNKNKRRIPSDEFKKILTVKGEISQAVYLTREEMLRIIKFKTVGPIEQFVRRNFVVEMLTGARRCDAQRLTIHNCDIGTGNLSYVPQKTPGIVVTVPVDERMHLRRFLADEYQRDCWSDVFNDTIRHICEKCHIDTVCSIRRRGKQITAPKWQLVSSHTARRSFATNLFLEGMSLEDIAMLMGHGKNIETTKRYICAERPVTRFIKSFFKKEQKPPENVDVFSYNKAIDDVLNTLEINSWASPEGLLYRTVDDLKIPTESLVVANGATK